MTNPSPPGQGQDPSLAGRCGRKTKRGPCKAWPVKGATVCAAHGGRAPQVRRKAAERVAAQQALADLGRHGVVPVVNPLEALAGLAGEIVATKDIFRERVSQLREEAWRYSDAKGGEQLRAEIAMYERALDRSARVLADIARLKIDERLTAITEQQVQTLVTVFTAVLERLDLGEKAGQVRELVAVEMERIGA